MVKSPKYAELRRDTEALRGASFSMSPAKPIIQKIKGSVSTKYYTYRDKLRGARDKSSNTARATMRTVLRQKSLLRISENQI
jgi:hypothetical protein